MSMTGAKTMGLIVNPIAGMGGRVGLKGTDGTAALAEARRRGAQPASHERVLKALVRLLASGVSPTVLTASGAVGADVAHAAGLEPRIVHAAGPGVSTAADTQAAARAMLRARVDLLLFAGGDGTARDILDVVGSEVPILGIPAGVKMVSAVFGNTPDGVGALAAHFLAGNPAVRVRDAEVMDIDEDAARGDRVATRLYGYARNPYMRAYSQNAKAGSSPNEDVALESVCRQIAREMQPDRLYILGPGTTTRRVMSALSLPSTLLGIDVVRGGRLVGSDLNEADLLGLMEGREVSLIVGVLGGHGSLFGRGNQQLSSEVIRRIGRDNIVVVASIEKLLKLSPRALHVDTGDDAVDAMLAGHIAVRTAPDRSILFQVRS
jgi:predicted polyphosphate/ATP-dependent NAD kinase